VPWKNPPTSAQFRDASKVFVTVHVLLAPIVTATPVPPTEGEPLLEFSFHCVAQLLPVLPVPESVQAMEVFAPPRRDAMLKIATADLVVDGFLSVNTAVLQSVLDESHAAPLTVPKVWLNVMVRLTEPMMPTDVIAHPVQVEPVHVVGVDTVVRVTVPRPTV
jgi:hypothetical protein